MTRQVIERDNLGVLTRIGQGDQGVVYGAPNAKTKFAASIVYKEYTSQTLAEIDFTALAAMPALVEESLSSAQAERLIAFAAWPCALVEDAGTPTGFVMPTIPAEFFIPLTTVKGVSNTTTEFRHPPNHLTLLVARGIDIEDVQRYSLLREIASALVFLHNHGVCVGDISLKNILFSLTPHEAVYFIACDAMRINGVSARRQVQSPGWDTPPGEELASIYSDTYKLGLLALRLLAGDHDTKNLQHIPSTTPDLLRQIITDTLTNQPHQRPLPEAWTYVLGHAIEQAQHRKKIATPPPTPVSAPPAPPPTPIVHSRPPVGAFSPPIGEPARPLSEPMPLVKPPTSSTTKIWAGVSLTAVVIAALVVITVALANHNNGAPSSAPQASSTEPSSYSAYSPPTQAPTPTPTAAADVSGMAPFVGSWHAHEERLDIEPNGHGREMYNDRSTCPDAPMAGCGKTGTTDFMLTSVAGDTATGTITAASDPKQPIGGPVTIDLVGGGQGLLLTIAGGDQGFPFCNNNDNDDAMHYYCGA